MNATPPKPLPDIMYDGRSKLELARDEYASGRISLEELEWHVEVALKAEAA